MILEHHGREGFKNQQAFHLASAMFLWATDKFNFDYIVFEFESKRLCNSWQLQLDDFFFYKINRRIYVARRNIQFCIVPKNMPFKTKILNEKKIKSVL